MSSGEPHAGAHGAPAAAPASDGAAPPRQGRLSRLIHKAWWLHSFGALAFGVGVMLFARQGLAYADKLLIVLGVSWLLMFVALRFIVGRKREDEHIARKGVRLLTNYVIKNLYQQMFFFLVPMYASSATWSLSSFNWWLAPVLLVFAVLSTMDLVFDNFIMERRVLASAMYGVALFGVLNLMLPVVAGIGHFPALVISAGATAPAVALLSFRARSVLSAQGLLITIAVSAALVAGAWYGRKAIPAVPLVLVEGAVGHGTFSSYECLPGKKYKMRVDQLDGLRCGVMVTEPGGVRDKLIHIWKRGGEVVKRSEPERLDGCGGDVFRSQLGSNDLPEELTGQWACVVETSDGQLVGRMKFQIVTMETKVREAADADADADLDAGADSDSDAGAGADTSTGAEADANSEAGADSEADADAQDE